MNEMKKQYVVRDGQVFTAHVNRDGHLVDFRPCSLKIRTSVDDRISVLISPGKGVHTEPIKLFCTYEIRLWPEEPTKTTPVRIQHATKITFSLGGQNVEINQEVNLGQHPGDLARHVEKCQEEDRRESQKKATQQALLVSSLTPVIVDLMKTPLNRKQLLRWARTGRIDDASEQRMFGRKILPNELKEVILRIDEEDRAARKQAWLAANPQT